MLQLPTEIIEIILDFLYDDPRSLAMCSRVGRNWVAACRFHIFHESISLTQRSSQQFIALAQHPLSTICMFVRGLEFDGALASGDREAISTIQFSHGYCWLVNATAATMGRFPNLRSLGLTNFDLRDFSADLISSFSSVFSNVTEFTLTAIEFASVSDVLDLTSTLPNLRHWSLRNVQWDDPSFSSTVNFPNVPSSLQSLQLEDCYKRDIISWLLSLKPVPLISHIDFGKIYPKDAPTLGEYLKVLGPALLTLRLGFFSLDSGGDAG